MASRQIAVAMTARLRLWLPRASKAETGRDLVAKPEQAEEECPRRQQMDTERYLLQIDRQTKQLCKTPGAAQVMAVEIEARFPNLQVAIYDSVSNSRTVVR